MGFMRRIPPFSWARRSLERHNQRRFARALRALHAKVVREEVAWRRSSECEHLQRMVHALGLHNCHAGERCFIMGNGPSLNETDLSRLKNEFTIGMNRIFLLFDRIDWRPSYFVSVNQLVIQQSAAEISSLKMPKFLSLRAASDIDLDGRTAFVRPLDLGVSGPGFSRDIRRGWWEGATVTYCALQLAFFLGFKTLVLVGVDHSFHTEGKPHKGITSKSADRDHFAPDYFGPGFHWQLPDLEWSEYSYQQARDAYEADGREVLDATVGGKLNVFRKVEYDSLF